MPARLKIRYENEIRPALIERFGYSSPMEAPKVLKVTVNMGVGDGKQDSKIFDAAAEQLGDVEQSGIAHADLAMVLMERGNFPNALAEQERALQLYANSRGGLYAAFGFTTLALIESRAGLYAKSTEALSNAEARSAKLEGSQTQLRAAILSTHAEAAYSQRQWTQAAHFSQQALALPSNDADPNARLLAGLAAIRMGKIDAGLSEASGSIQQYDQKERQLAAAAGRLALAEALWDSNRQSDAQALAKAALGFFEPLENWEAIWQCRRILDDPKAAEALDRCRQILGPEMFESYRKRPILEKLLP